MNGRDTNCAKTHVTNAPTGGLRRMMTGERERVTEHVNDTRNFKLTTKKRRRRTGRLETQTDISAMP